MLEYQINFQVAALAAVGSFVLGYIYYAPFVFGKVWNRLAGITHKSGMSGKKLIGGYVTSLVLAIGYAVIMPYVNVMDYSDGLCLAFFLWGFFIVPVMFGAVLWQNCSLALFIGNALYQYLSLSVIAAIFVYMG